jgi:hypothetical protein
MRELVQPEVQEVSGGKDCTYASQTYSKGAVLTQADGKAYVCTGDADGTWKSGTTL